MSTSPLYPNIDNGRTLMSETFANNIGTDNTLVFSGPRSVTSPGCAGPSPCPFDVVIPLSTPFFYNPALGSLLVDLQSTGFNATSGSFDDALFPFPPGGGLAIVAGTLGAPTGSLSPLGTSSSWLHGMHLHSQFARPDLHGCGRNREPHRQHAGGMLLECFGAAELGHAQRLSGTGTTALSFQLDPIAARIKARRSRLPAFLLTLNNKPRRLPA